MTRPTAITYHAIGECPAGTAPKGLFVSTSAFEAQMEFLAARRRVVPLGVAQAGGQPQVALCFDDAYRSVLDVALPILLRLGLPATVFVPTKWIGARNEWDTYDPSACALDILSADELRAIAGEGIAIESHGHAHARLDHMTASDVRADLEASASAIEAVTGRRSRFLAYPWGCHNDTVRECARAVGFERAFTIGVPDEGPYALERVAIGPGDGRRTFALKTSGRYIAWRYSWLGRTGAGVVRGRRNRSMA